jgi:hypothetical protein
VRIEVASEGAGELLKAFVGWGKPRGPSKAGGGRQGGRLGKALDGLPADADAVARPAVASRRVAPTEALTGLLGLCEGGDEWGSPRSAAALLAAKAACRASRWPPPVPPTGDGALGAAKLFLTGADVSFSLLGTRLSFAPPWTNHQGTQSRISSFRPAMVRPTRTRMALMRSTCDPLDAVGDGADTGEGDAVTCACSRGSEVNTILVIEEHSASKRLHSPAAEVLLYVCIGRGEEGGQRLSGPDVDVLWSRGSYGHERRLPGFGGAAGAGAMAGDGPGRSHCVRFVNLL